MERSRWLCMNSKYVCIPVFDLGAVMWVRSSVNSLSHAHSLSRHTSMTTVYVHLSWWTRCNHCVCRWWTGCTFIFLCLNLTICFGFNPHEVILSRSFCVKLYLDGDGRRVFILVESTERCRLPWTNRSYVCTPACLTLKMSLRFNPESLFHLLPMSQYITMTMVGVRLPWLNRWNDPVVHGQTECTFVSLRLTLGVLVVFNSVCVHNVNLNSSQLVLSRCIYLGCIDGTISFAFDD